MLIRFFTTLRQHGLKVSPRDLITLHEVMDAGLAQCDIGLFYQLARMSLVKDETQFDRFDQAFAHFYEGLGAMPDPLGGELPEDWLRLELDRHFTEQEKREIEAMGGLKALMKALELRLKEQTARHEGGNRWIGTGGTSPFGHGGYNPEGVRIGGPGRHRRAAKVWEKRHYRNLDDKAEIGTRNIKLALRKLRRFARTGARQELDLDGTIRFTARNAGLLDIRTRPERHNAVKVLALFDVGGSMDDHVQLSEALFTACRGEFKHVEHYYFHNFLYEQLWRDNHLHHDNLIALDDLLHTYGPDYKVIIVGDASMSPYEIAAPFGAIDFMNPKPGEASFRKLSHRFERLVWLNPVPERYWDRTYSIGMVRKLVKERMYPLTVEGLERAIASLQGRRSQA